MKIRIDRLALAVFIAASVIILGWFFFSWIEIVCKNLAVGATYNHYNAFVMLCDLF